MKKKIAIIIAAVCGAAVLVVAGILVARILSERAAEDEYGSMAGSVPAVADTTAADAGGEAQPTTQPLVDNPIDFATLKQQNGDIYSWITIPDTNVNYPVLQSRVNDNFYIDHGLDQSYSFPGAIYSQLCNRTDYTDRVTVLYGHNMRDGSMFATLHQFEDKAFFDSHEYFYVYTENMRLTYRVVSAYVADDSHIMNSHNFTDDKVFEDYLDATLRPYSLNSNVREGVSLDISDRLLILSTCLNAGEGRYLVVCELAAADRTR